MVNMGLRGNQVIPGAGYINQSIVVRAKIKHFIEIKKNVLLRHTTAWLNLKA